MIELGNQIALLFLHPFAVGYVNADADDSMRASFTAIGNETAGLDPTHLAISTNDTILYAIFAPALTERLAAELSYLLLCRRGEGWRGIRCVLISAVPSGKPWIAT